MDAAPTSPASIIEWLARLGLTVPDALAFFASDIRGRYVAAGTLSLIIYDHLLTLGEEIDYLRGTGWSVAKALFLINRYFVLVLFGVSSIQLFTPGPPDALCRQLVLFTIWSTVFLIAVIGASIAQRVDAFWNHDFRVRGLLSVLFVVCFMSSALAVGVTIHDIEVVPPPLGGPPGCLTAHKEFWGAFVPAIVFDVVLVVLTVVRARALRPRTHTPLIAHVFHSGVLYFTIMLLSNVLVAASFAWPYRLAPVVVPANISTAVGSVLCTRMLLHLRAAGADSAHALSYVPGTGADDDDDGVPDGTHTHMTSDAVEHLYPPARRRDVEAGSSSGAGGETRTMTWASR